MPIIDMQAVMRAFWAAGAHTEPTVVAICKHTGVPERQFRRHFATLGAGQRVRFRAPTIERYLRALGPYGLTRKNLVITNGRHDTRDIGHTTRRRGS